MKFRKGNKVEFLEKMQTPFGAWRTAEIISGNGHTYVVQYDQCPPHGHTVLEKMSRKNMRPCPPVVGDVDWAVGDIVEFFNRGSWKPAEVRGTLSTHYYYVSLIGSSREFRACKSSLRSRQTWQGNKWVVVQKDTGKSRARLSCNLYNEGKPSYLLPNSCVDTLSSTRENQPDKNCIAAFGQPTRIISRCCKKRPFCALLSTYNCEEGGRKKRVLGKNGSNQDAAADQPRQILDKGQTKRLAKHASWVRDHGVIICSSLQTVWQRFHLILANVLVYIFFLCRMNHTCSFQVCFVFVLMRYQKRKKLSGKIL